MDINPNVHQDDTENVFGNQKHSPRALNSESALWFRLDWLIRSIDQNRESAEGLQCHLASEVRVMKATAVGDTEAIEKKQVYLKAVGVIENWLRVISS